MREIEQGSSVKNSLIFFNKNSEMHSFLEIKHVIFNLNESVLV
jgi:hypothetical protein